MNKRTEMTAFCNNIKKLREMNKLSKREMAKRLCIGVKSLTMIENGIIPPRLSAKIIMMVCKNFDVTPSKLFTPL